MFISAVEASLSGGVGVRMRGQLAMQLHGPIEDNLKAALASARRLRGHPVHLETLTHWNGLLHEARRTLLAVEGDRSSLIRRFVTELENETADRGD